MHAITTPAIPPDDRFAAEPEEAVKVEIRFWKIILSILIKLRNLGATIR
jgi:hypothetical protein